MKILAICLATLLCLSFVMAIEESQSYDVPKANKNLEASQEYNAPEKTPNIEVPKPRSHKKGGGHGIPGFYKPVKAMCFAETWPEIRSDVIAGTRKEEIIFKLENKINTCGNDLAILVYQIWQRS